MVDLAICDNPLELLVAADSEGRRSVAIVVANLGQTNAVNLAVDIEVQSFEGAGAVEIGCSIFSWVSRQNQL